MKYQPSLLERRPIEKIKKDIKFYLIEARHFRMVTQMSYHAELDEMNREAEFYHSLYMVRRLRKELRERKQCTSHKD